MHVLPSKEALAESSPGYMLPPQQELGMENRFQLGETRAGNWFQSCQAPGMSALPWSDTAQADRPSGRNLSTFTAISKGSDISFVLG